MGNVSTAHTGHQFATAITPAFAAHFGSEACTCPCQETVAGEQAPCIGDGVIGEHILAETIPFGGVAQIETVLTTLYGTEENFIVDTTEECHMTVSDGRTGTAHYGLATEFASAVLGIVHPYGCRCSTLPLGRGNIALLQFADRHVHGIGVHRRRQPQGINLRLIATEDKQAIAGCGVLHGHTGLQTALVGQGGSQCPLLGIAGILQRVHLLVGHAETLSACHPDGSVVIGGRKVVKCLWQIGDGGNLGVYGIVEDALAECPHGIHTSHVDGTSGNLHTGTIGSGVIYLLSAIGTGHVGKVASAGNHQFVHNPTCIVAGYGLLHGNTGGGDDNTVLSHAEQGTEH